MLNLTDANFHQTINGNSKIVIDFYADWCAPCRAIAPLYQRWSEIHRNKATFAKCNISGNPNVTENFRIGSLPTFIVLVNGLETRRFSGSIREADLVAAIS